MNSKIYKTLVAPGQAVRVGPRPAGIKCGAGWPFQLVTPHMPPRISPQPARASSGVGRAGPLIRKKKNWHLAAGQRN